MMKLFNFLFKPQPASPISQANANKIIQKAQTITQQKLKMLIIRIFIRLKDKIKNSRGIKSLIILLVICTLYYIYKLKNPQLPPSHKKVNKNTSKNVLKRNSSLLSIKQFESHSNQQSDTSSQNQNQDPNINVNVNMKRRQLKKQPKQYCTDIQTQPYHGHNQTIESKRDHFFFNLIGSYQKTAKQRQQVQLQNRPQNQNQGRVDRHKSKSKSIAQFPQLSRKQTNKNEQLDYQCQYQQEYQGQNQMSPTHNNKEINDKLKLSNKMSQFQLQRKTSAKRLKTSEK